MAQAKKLKEEHPDLAELVKQGKLTLQDALKEAKKAKQAHRADTSPIPQEEQVQRVPVGAVQLAIAPRFGLSEIQTGSGESLDHFHTLRLFR